jgi:ribose 5-phosphate isomerase B
MLKINKIYLGADHAGWQTKEYLKNHLLQKDIKIVDVGNKKFDPQDDYPDFAKKVAKKVAPDKQSLGILICGSGQGMCMTANKFKNVRAALGWSVAAVKRSRYDNDSNILCLSGWKHTHQDNVRLVKAWLNTPFSQIAKYKRRIKKIHG